jgi:hypothetical protein
MKTQFRIMLVSVSAFFLLSQSALCAESRQATIGEIEGTVLVKTAANDWVEAKEGTVLDEKDEVRTTAGSTAVILLDDNKVGKVEMKEKSYFRLNTLKQDPATGKRTTLIDLAEGKLRVHAQKLKEGSKFEVRTPTAIAGVRGTVFDVGVDEKKA